tara:strand:- start:391 stop:813 length:423 start_codon:yes stop_codon:yes gene_type:complete
MVMAPVLGIIIFLIFLNLISSNIISFSFIQSGSYISDIKFSASTIANSINSFEEVNGFMLPESEWKKSLLLYDDLPELQFDSEWYYSIDGNDRYLCLSGNDNEAVSQAFNHLAETYSKYRIDYYCGETPQQDTLILSYKI